MTDVQIDPPRTPLPSPGFEPRPSPPRPLLARPHAPRPFHDDHVYHDERSPPVAAALADRASAGRAAAAAVLDVLGLEPGRGVDALDLLENRLVFVCSERKGAGGVWSALQGRVFAAGARGGEPCRTHCT